MAEPVSALGGRVAEQGLSIRIQDRGPVGQVLLRGGAQVQAAGLAALGLAAPGLRQVVQEGGRAVVWLAPDEVLVLCPHGEAPGLAAALGTALAGQHHLALDVSDARAVLRLTGAGVGEVLAKGAPVDLRDAAFPVGSVRRTHLGQIAVAFWRVDAQTYDLVCFRSVAGHVFDWLVRGAARGTEVGHF